MHYVYILKDDNSDIYIGYSSNIELRLENHLNKEAYYTSRLINPRLYYYEGYQTIEMAREREKHLKQFGSSYTGLMKRIGLKK